MFLAKKSALTALYVFVILMAASYCLAIMYPPNDGLRFEITDGIAFLPGSTDHPENETTEVQFGLTFGYGEFTTVPIGSMTRIQTRFTYDTDKLVLIDIQPTADWNGQFDTSVYAGEGSFEEISLQFWGGDVDPPSSMTYYATMTFELKEQLENTGSDLTLNRDDDISNVQVDAEVWYPGCEDCWGDGSATVGDYQPGFTFHDTLLAGALETEFLYPVYATANFRMFHIWQKIIYDNTKLEFLGFADDYDDIFTGGCVDPEMCPGLENDTITICLWAGHDPVGGYLYIPEMEEEAKLYSLRFKVIDVWDGDFTDIQFIADSCMVTAYNPNSSVPYYDIIDTNPDEYTDGRVTLEEYTAEYRAILTENNIVPGGDFKVKYTIQMKNRFPAGIAPWETAPDTGNIAFNFLLDEDLDYERNTELDTNLVFWADDHTNGDHRLSIYQVPGSGGDDFWPVKDVQTDAVELQFEYMGDLPDRYSHRSIDFDFTSANPYSTYGHTARVVDTSHHNVTATQANGKLTWEADPLEITMGEFFGAGGYSKYDPEVSNTLRMVNNFTVDVFSLTISVGPDFYISSVQCQPGVIAHRVSFGSPTSIWEIQSTGAVDWDPITSGYHVLATVHYKLRTSCTDGQVILITRLSTVK